MIEYYNNQVEKIDEIAKQAINETIEYGKEFILNEANKIRLPDEKAAYQASYIVKAEKVGNKIEGSIRTDDEKATYAENGTGIVGSRHPNTSIKGWIYDVNNHGEAGWNYKGSDGKYHHTKGIPAQKIYYQASRHMRKKLKEAFKEAWEKMR